MLGLSHDVHTDSWADCCFLYTIAAHCNPLVVLADSRSSTLYTPKVGTHKHAFDPLRIYNCKSPTSYDCCEACTTVVTVCPQNRYLIASSSAPVTDKN